MDKTILIIDDDADDRAMFCEALEEVAPAFSCYTATNGRIAFAKLSKGEVPLPDLIFLDINMPVMNGWQFLTALQNTEDFRHVPVIVYSTSSYPEDVEKARSLGALTFLSKPSNFQRLKAIISVVVKHIHSNTLEALKHQHIIH